MYSKESGYNKEPYVEKSVRDNILKNLNSL
jgi:hypothetical protein